MVIPLYDINPRRTVRVPYVTYGLIGACTFIYGVFQSGLAIDANFASVVGFGMVPADFPGLDLSTSAGIPEPLTLITYMFLHGGWLHLLGNMLFLWVFGDNVEDAMGHIKFLMFYMLCGIAGRLAHSYMLPSSKLPLIGASGAVAGVIAAYLILHPRVLVWVLAFRIIPLRISAAWVLGVWVVTQLAMVLLNQPDQVAWWAHVGGMAAGAVLILFLRRPGVPLFDRWLTPA